MTTDVVTLATQSYAATMSDEKRHGTRPRSEQNSQARAESSLDTSVTQRRNASGLARDIEIVELLATAHSGDGMGVSQLAAASGRDKGVISRALATLLEAGMVSRDSATLRYRIGPRVFALAARSVETALVTAARPILRRAAAVRNGQQRNADGFEDEALVNRHSRSDQSAFAMPPA